MKKFIDKKVKSARIYRIFLLILLLMFVCSFFIIPHVDSDIPLMVASVSVISLILFSLIYYLLFHLYAYNFKWLIRNGYENIADDIDLTKPTLPRSGIYCGENALFSKKSKLIMPYSEMAWLYLYRQNLNGINIENSIIINTTDGKCFHLYHKGNEFNWLMVNYIMSKKPDVIVGFGSEQKKRYLEISKKKK